MTRKKFFFSDGNPGGTFKLDPRSGALSASSLDRESVSKYVLTLSAKDKGRPALEARCNLTVLVLDVNDNAPTFVEPGPRQKLATKYTASVPEDAPVDSSVVQVRAFDLDDSVNGKVTYAIAEETSWLFRVDNLTGLISTSG